MKRALLIGGTGQIGWASAENLLSHGWDVTVASRSASPGPDGSTPLALDRDDADAVVATADGFDLVMDAVAYTPAHGAALAKLAGRVGSLVVISTASVYTDSAGRYLDVAGERGFPDFPVPVTEAQPTVDNDEHTYSPDKAALERHLLAVDGLAVSFLRPGAVHGAHSPFLREWFFARRALDKRDHVVLAYDGLSRFGTSATVNIAELVRLCAEQPAARVLNAADDDAPTVAEIGRAVFDALGHECEIVGMPGEPRDDLGGSPWAVPTPFVQSMQLARSSLGYEPVASYREAIAPAVEWFLAHQGVATERMVERYGAATWFPYDEEDAYMKQLRT